MGLGSISAGKVAAASDVRMLETAYNVLSFTRPFNTATGAVAYTGYGFKPKALLALGNAGGSFNAFSIGFFASTHVYIMHNHPTASTTQTSAGTSHILRIEDYSNRGQEASVQSLDADGFTFMWSHINAASAQSASIGFSVMAFGNSSSV